jgi:hypothetical protein
LITGCYYKENTCNDAQIGSIESTDPQENPTIAVMDGAATTRNWYIKLIKTI